MKLTSLKQFTMVASVILLAAICAFWVQQRRTIVPADSARVVGWPAPVAGEIAPMDGRIDRG